MNEKFQIKVLITIAVLILTAVFVYKIIEKERTTMQPLSAVAMVDIYGKTDCI